VRCVWGAFWVGAAQGTNSGTTRIYCCFNTLAPLAADFISANYPYLRQITASAADMKLVVSQQTIKRESTPVDAADVLSFSLRMKASSRQILNVDGGFTRSGA
jgi:hypothetical protein